MISKRSLWKISLLVVCSACTAAGLFMLHAGAAGAGVDEALADDSGAAVAAAITDAASGLELTLSDDGTYYIVSGLAEGYENKTEVVIPDAIGDLPVAEVAAGAFEGNTTVKSLTIGANLDTYGAGAFADMTCLENLYYNNTVEYSSTYAGSVKSSDYVFRHMGTDTAYGTKITIGAKSHGIPAYLFAASSSADAGKISDVVFEDNSAFSYIGSDAFINDAASGNVYITDLSAWCGTTFNSNASNPVDIGMDMYLNNKLATEIVIPDDVTAITNYAFLGCKTLRSLTIHGNVSSIGTSAFQACASLEYIYFGAINCSVSTNAFYAIGADTDGVTLVIGKDVQYIGQTAFSGLNSQTGHDTVTFEEGSVLISIGQQAFMSTGFTSITIPGSTSIIGAEAFKDSGITVDTLFFENPYDWYTTDKTGQVYDPEDLAAGILYNTKVSGRTTYYATTLEVLRGFVDETSDADKFSVSLWWFERYKWTASISGTTLEGETVSGSYSNHDKISEPGEYAITMVNSSGSDTLTYYIHIQDAITTDPTCTEDGLEQYLVSYTLNGETTEMDSCDIVLPATGHTYITEPVWQWTWDEEKNIYTAATASFACEAGDDAAVSTAVVSLSDSGTTYTATAVFEDELYTDVIHIHSYSITGTEWSGDCTTYTVTLTCAGADGDACTAGILTEYAQVTGAATPATCTEDGYTVYTATYNGIVLDTMTVTDTGSATGHTYSTPSWSWTNNGGLYSATATFVCTAGDDIQTIDADDAVYDSDNERYSASVTGPDGNTYTDTYDHSHLYNVTWEWAAITEGTSADGTASDGTGTDGIGNVTGYTVTLTLSCQQQDETLTYILTAVITAHADATCTVDGYTTYEASYGDYRDVRTDTISATGHDWSIYTDATCTEDGYYTCANCGETLTDEDAPALGHDYDYAGARWTWVGYDYVMLTIECTRGDDYIGARITPESTTIAATCTQDGSITYVATYEYTDTDGNEQSISDTAVVILPATGHYYDNAVWDWAEDGSSAKVTLTCTYCNDEITLDATVYVTDSGTTFIGFVTAEQDGNDVSFRDTCHVHIYAISGTEWTEIAGKGTDEDADSSGWSCTVTYTCIGTYCEGDEEQSYTRTATISYETTNPSCTEDGATVYTATVDGVAVDTHTVIIAATGHTYGEPIWSWTMGEDNAMTAFATFYCTEWDDEQIIKADIVKVATPFASVYYATVTDPYGTETYTSSETVAHLFNVEWTWTAVTDDTDADGTGSGTKTDGADGEGNITGYTATVTLTCQICGNSYVYDATVTLQAHRDAACEVTGYSRYEASFTLGEGDEAVVYTDTRTDRADALEHDYVGVVTEPTCTEQGYTTYTCTLCGDEYTDDITDALGHDYGYAAAVWTWYEGNAVAKVEITCSRCGDVITEYIRSTYEVTEEPECEQTGIGTYTATYDYVDADGESKSISSSVEEYIPATGHSYVQGEFEWTSETDDSGRVTAYTAATVTFTCSACGDEQTVEATIITRDDGTTYVARAVFEDEIYRDTQHVHVYSITATDWSIDEEDESNTSCTVTYTCIAADCSDYYTVNADVTYATTAATCTDAGYILYTAAVNGETVSTYTVTIEATGHSYGDANWSWTKLESGYSATAKFYCETCGHEYEAAAEISADLTESGTLYTATAKGPDGETYEDIINVAHVFNVVWTWEAVTDADGDDSVTGYTVTLTLTCQICGNVFTHTSDAESGTANVEVKVIEYKAAACEVAGYTTYEATYTYVPEDEDEASVTYTDTRTDAITALTHEYTETVTPATCTERGYTTHTCSICGDTYTDSYTNALGHDYDYANAEWSWAGYNSAEAVVTCTRCQDEYHTGYITSESEVTTEATCTDDGERTYTVTYQYGETEEDSITSSRTEPIPATGHTYERADAFTWTEDTDNGGYTASLTFTCSTCQATYTANAAVVLGDNGTTYYATVIFEGATYTDSYHVHVYEITATTWNIDGEDASCIVTYTCIGGTCDDSHTVSADVTSVTTDSSCTETGATVYTATVNGVAVDTYTVTISVIEHSYGSANWNWTKLEEGYSATAAFYCEVCGHEYTVNAEISSELTESGTIYTATVTGPDGETYTDDTNVTHVFSVAWTWEAVTGENGETTGYTVTITLTCQICDNVFTHTSTAEDGGTPDVVVNEIEYKAAACEVEGYTTYEATYTYVPDNPDEANVTYTDTRTDAITALEHDYAGVVTEPTCTEKGYTTYTCTLCGDTYRDVYTNALGHDYEYAAAVWTWYEGNAVAKVEITCSRCGDVITEYIRSTYEVTTPATCTADGVGTYTATYQYGEDDEDVITSTQTEDIPATGHSYSATDDDWTWTSETDANGRVTAYTAATLTFTCSACDDEQIVDATIFIGDDGTTYTARVVYEGTVYRATQHVHVYNITDTAWSEDGEVISCTVTYTCIAEDCSDYYTVNADVTYATTAATCTDAGYILYTAAVNGETVDTYKVDIAATGHSFGDANWSWTKLDNGYSATAKFYCEVCGYEQSAEAEVSATTTESSTVYAASAEFGGEKYTTEISVAHVFSVVWTWTAVADAEGDGGVTGYTVTITLTCQICGNVFTHTSTAEDGGTPDVAVVVKDEKAAACEVAGYTTYEATYTYATDNLTYTDTRTDEITALEHNYEAVVTEPTCTEQGYTTHTCSICGDTYTDSNTDALGHDYDYANAKWSWAGYNSAEAIVTCTRCDDVYHTGYITSVSVETIPATCTAGGVRTYTVTYQYGDTEDEAISDSKTETIPATGHSYEAAEAFTWTLVTDADGNGNAGYTAALTFTCSACQDIHIADAAVVLGDNGTTYYATVIFEGATYTDSYHVHVYEITAADWSIDSENASSTTCTVTYTCMGADCDDSYDVETTVTYVTTAPTCTEDGRIVYTARYEGVVVARTTVVLEATGHTYTDYSWSWDRDEDGNLIAAATFRCEAWDDELVLEAEITPTPTPFATVYTATVTGPDGETYTTETSVAHVFNVEWNWEETEDTEDVHKAFVTLTCQICGRSFTYEAAVTEMAHRDAACEVEGYTLYEAVYVHGSDDDTQTYTSLHADIEEAWEHQYRASVTDPTCTEQGYVTFTCSVCGDAFTDEYTSANGHSYDYANAVWTWNGLSGAYAVITCSVCGDEIVTDQLAAAATVTLEPGCETTGITVYTVTYIYNEYAGRSISSSVEEITDALGHTYDTDPVWTWAEDYSSAAATFTCSTCGGTLDVEATVESAYSGTTYLAFLTLDGTLYINKVHFHSFYVSGITWNEDNTSCTFTVLCAGAGADSCGWETDTYVCTVSEDIHPATCTEDGYTVYTAVYNGIVMDVLTVTDTGSATGHSYEEPYWSWDLSGGNIKATAYFVCKDGDDIVAVVAEDATFDTVLGGYTASVTGPDEETYTDTEDHTHIYNVAWTWTAVKDDEGNITGYTVTLTLTCINGYEKHEHTVIAVVAAYIAPGCETTGNTVYEAVYGEYADVKAVVTDATGHSWTSETFAATCTEDAYTVYTCSRCGETHTVVSDTNLATGHSYSKESIQWIWAGTSAAELIITCDTCGDTAVMVYIPSTDSVTKEATCTETGIKTFTVTYTYKDSNGDEQTISDSIDEEVPALGHTYAAAESFAWTEDADNGGYTATLTFTCSVCGETYTADADVVLGDSGTTYYATVTGPDGNTYTASMHVHVYEIAGTKWSIDSEDASNTSCTITFTCVGEDCEHYTYTAPADITSVTTAPSCTEPGETVYTATYEDAVVSTYTEIIPATGHAYGDPVWSWSKDADGNYSAVAIFTCAEGDDEFKLDAVITSETQTDGTIIYTATVVYDGETYTDTSEHEHLYTITWTWADDCSSATLTLTCVDEDSTITGDATVTVISHAAAECETDGYTVYEATYTNGTGESAITYTDIITVILAAHGHSYAASEVAPTCVDDGYTLYRCRHCGDIYTVAGEPATGEHELDEDSAYWSWVLNADGTYSAYLVYNCIAEGTEAHTVSYEGHIVYDTITEATCVTGGSMMMTATYGRHGDWIIVDVPATGEHECLFVLVELNETAKTVQATYICSVCGQDLIDELTLTVTDSDGNVYIIAFVNGIADYSSVSSPVSVTVTDAEGTQVSEIEITAAEPDNPSEPDEPSEPGTGDEEEGTSVVTYAFLIVLGVVVVGAIAVIACVFITRRKYAKKRTWRRRL